MKYFSSFVVLSLLFVNAGFSAYLPVVDVSRGDVSARALFGEEIAPQNTVTIAPVAKENKKVVARAARKSTNANVTNGDVLQPRRPSSDLWARTDSKLRMPRMDEIAVINSDALLPEESLNTNNVAQRVSRDEVTQELKQLRSEIAHLRELSNDEKISRHAIVRTPIVDENNTKTLANQDNVNVRRAVVPMETQNIARNTIKKIDEPKISSVNEMSKMSPNELKKAFKKTYLSENKHLSTYQMDDRYDEVSDMTSSVEGFSAQRDLSEMNSGVRPLEIKISFLNNDSGLSRENYNILSETASIVVNNPKRAIQIAIPESVTHDKDARKLASRRLAIVEQVLRDTGVAEQRIVPVLSQRDDDVFVLRIISGDVFETLNQQKRNASGNVVSQKTYKSMSW